MEIQSEIKKLQGYVTDTRRKLHQIPELGLQEVKTSAYIREQLTALKPDRIIEVIETGTIAIFTGSLPGKTVAYRADIDALPVTEATGSAFASTHLGKMHACGHDGHVATLLGFARYLSEHRDSIPGKVLLIFQPAEEGPGGAQLIVETGILQEEGVEEVIGLHVFPEYPEGTIACRAGGMMARNGEVTITINGLSAHGAQPQQGHDAILAAAAVIQAIHTVISRNISPLDSGVLTFGDIKGGEAMNIIPGSVTINGTIRAFSDAVYDTMVRRLEEIVAGIASGYGCEGHIVFNHMYRVVDNDPRLVAALQQACGKAYIETPPYMLAEDFSLYQQAFPGLFFFVGTRNEAKGYVHPLHSNKLQFDEAVLLNGIQVYVNLLAELNQ